MAGNIYIGEILRNKEIQKIASDESEVASSFDDPLPGQFVMIRIAGLNDPFLSLYQHFSFFPWEKSVRLNCSIVSWAKEHKFGRLIEGSQVEIHDAGQWI